MVWRPWQGLLRPAWRCVHDAAVPCGLQDLRRLPLPNLPAFLLARVLQLYPAQRPMRAGSGALREERMSLRSVFDDRDG